MKDSRSPAGLGFSLVEMLVALVVLTMIMTIVFQITTQTAKMWKGTTAQIQSFQAARAAFESMSRRISQATLNTHYDYFDASGNAPSSYSSSNQANFVPASYGRQSELQFVSGPGLLTGASNPTQVTHAIFFQAPLGYSTSNSFSELSNTLNTVGYYVTYNSDVQAGTRPSFIPTSVPYRYRYRLMQLTQTCESNSIYTSSNTTSWFTSLISTSNATATSPTHLLAENIIALVILPKESAQDDPTGTLLCPNYSFNSIVTTWSGTLPQPLQMNQLPPVVHLAMLALDEPSAQRICTSATAPTVLGTSTLFTNALYLNSDLATLESTLDTNHLTYRVFETDVAIRGAKWSN